MKATKRPITPHKGGRNAAFPRSRLTNEERAMLESILAHRGVSAADWVSEKIINEYMEIFGKEDAE